jgi:hypothetical protein
MRPNREYAKIGSDDNVRISHRNLGEFARKSAMKDIQNAEEIPTPGNRLGVSHQEHPIQWTSVNSSKFDSQTAR